MKQLIDQLHRAIEEAKLQCASRRPSMDLPPEYLFGYCQGKYVGLNEALKIVRDVLLAENEEEEFK